jgi:hypothetical protein
MILPLLTPRGISFGSVTASVDASIKSTIPSPEFVFTLAEKPTLVICGTLREVAQHLPTLRTMIHALVEDSFQLLRIVAFENDSFDETLSLLQDWNRDWPMTILSEQNLSLPERTQWNRDWPMTILSEQNLSLPKLAGLRLQIYMSVETRRTKALSAHSSRSGPNSSRQLLWWGCTLSL